MNQKPTENQTNQGAFDETIAQESGVDTNADADFSTDDIPSSMGRYTIEKLLGRGGMGSVYLAHDSQLDRKVALKVPKFGSNIDPKLVARFYREARSAATLSHPNLCPVFDIGEIKDTYYIAMAYVQGRTLASYVSAEKPPPQDAIASIIRKVALAMQEAHQNGIIHRDLKPANIMIDQRKEPIVMDFGLACPEDTSDESRLTQDGALMGSPAYMSPEQLKGDLDGIGAASDIYSLGVVLFELLAGRLPFSGSGSTMAMIGRILTEAPVELASLRSDVAPELVAICDKAMQKDIDQRFGSMREFADALADYLKSHQENATLPESKALRATDVSRIQLTEQSRMAKTLCESGQYAAAIPILQKIVASPESENTKMGQWAKQMLPQAEAHVQRSAQPASTAAQPTDDVFANLPDASPTQPLRVAPAARPATATKRRKSNSNSTAIIASVLAVAGIAVIGGAAWVFWPDSENQGASSIENTDPTTDTTSTGSSDVDVAGSRSAVGTSTDEASQDQSTSPDGNIPERFSRLDLDDNGFIEEVEIPLPERRRMMGADIDRDMRISLQEFSAHRPPPAPEERPSGRRIDDVMSLDTDGDGRIHQSEIPEYRRYLKSLDENFDGYIDKDEIRPLPPREQQPPGSGGRGDRPGRRGGGPPREQ